MGFGLRSEITLPFATQEPPVIHAIHRPFLLCELELSFHRETSNGVQVNGSVGIDGGNYLLGGLRPFSQSIFYGLRTRLPVTDVPLDDRSATIEWTEMPRIYPVELESAQPLERR